MSLDNNLMQILEIIDDVPAETTTVPVTVPPPSAPATIVETGDALVDDLEFARNNIRSLIDTGTVSIAELKAIAQSSEHPRAYEVLSTLLNTVVGLNNELIDLHKRKKELLKQEGLPQSNTTNFKVNQAVFVGSTAELSSLVRQEREKQENVSSLPPECES